MNTKNKILITVFLILMHVCYAQVRDTIAVAYVAVESYEIDFSTIKRLEKLKISDYQGSYHFGESEGESQLEIIFSNGKLYARKEYYDWEQDNWKFKSLREPIKYTNGKIIIGKCSYELYECTKTTYLTLNAGEKVLVSHSFENLNDKTKQNIQLNISKEVKVPKGKYLETSFVKLADSDISEYTKYDLKIMRNEIFARNGYSFKKGGDMDIYFSNQEWYNSIQKADNPKLDAIEKHNVSLISKFEKKS